MAKNEITVLNPLNNPLHLTSVGPTKTFFEKMRKKIRAYHYVDSKSANKTMPA